MKSMSLKINQLAKGKNHRTSLRTRKLTLLDIKRPRMANFLPALIIAPLMVAVATALGINIYPL